VLDDVPDGFVVEEEANEDAEPVLLDTDVFSFLLKGPPASDPWVPLVQGKYLLLCFVTVAELLLWAESHNWGQQRRDSLQAKIDTTTVLPYNEALMAEWARLVATARSDRHPIGAKAQANDAWIAATARLYRVPLATGNLAHYTGIPGLDLVRH
jgi:tRNA(fMet)-specific endonuclease VapC